MMVFMTSKTTGSETVFLSAGRDTDLERVRSDLRDRDFRTVEWRDLTTGGLARGLPAALESCDALVAVLDGTEVPAAVLMEIGAALGRGLPVVIVTAGTLETLDLPAALHELPAISAGHAQTTEARQAVSRRLVATLRTLINNAGDSSLKAASGSTVGSSSITGHSALEDDFARKVVAAIDRLGVRIVEEYEVGPVSRSRMADLAIWIEGLPHPLLNPVLVEIKKHQFEIEAAQSVLREHLGSTGTILGIVVVPGDTKPTWHFGSTHAVVSLGLDVLAALDPGGLVALLADGRNRWVHGLS